MLKSPSKETLWDSTERKSPEAAPPSSIIWRSLRSRSVASAAKSNSEKKGPCSTVFTQCTAHSFDSCTSWYNIPPLLAPSILFSNLFLTDPNKKENRVTVKIDNPRTLKIKKNPVFLMYLCLLSLYCACGYSGIYACAWERTMRTRGRWGMSENKL